MVNSEGYNKVFTEYVEKLHNSLVVDYLYSEVYDTLQRTGSVQQALSKLTEIQLKLKESTKWSVVVYRDPYAHNDDCECGCIGTEGIEVMGLAPNDKFAEDLIKEQLKIRGERKDYDILHFIPHVPTKSFKK